MKKKALFLRNINLYLLLFLFFIISACGDELTNPLISQDFKKQLTEEKSEIMSKPQKQQFEYVDKYLSHIGKGLLLYSDNDVFKNLLYSEIEKQFDGDFNVLLKTLADKSYDSKINLLQEMGFFLSTQQSMSSDVQLSIDAFKNLGEEKLTLYPQVFIPFYDELKEKKMLRKKLVMSWKVAL